VDPGLSPNPGDPSFQARIENNSFKFLFGWRRMKTVDKNRGSKYVAVVFGGRYVTCNEQHIINIQNIFYFVTSRTYKNAP